MSVLLVLYSCQTNKTVDVDDLEVDDDGKHQHCGQQVHQVRQVLAVESLAEATHFILTSGQQMKQSDHGSLKLRSYKQHQPCRRVSLSQNLTAGGFMCDMQDT